MAQEIDEGIAYLRALKRSAPDAAAPATARQATPGAQAGVNLASVLSIPEKRRSERYNCEGGVEMREVDREGVHTWSKFTDVSFHGCYVEAQATYPVGTELQMRLQVHGIKFETRGIVRVHYPFLGMGIEFGEMSETNREHMKQLVASLARYHVIVGPDMLASLPALTPRPQAPLQETPLQDAPLQELPQITRPQAAVQALLEFFQTRQMLTRDDF